MGTKLPLVVLLALCMMPLAAQAKVSAEEAERLKKDLTPMGAERAGNAEGTIPAYTGEFVGAPSWVDYKGTGTHYPDPYKDDKVLFTITKDNLDQYKDKLSEGTLKLFERYPESFTMPIYKSRRDTRYDDFVINNVYENATRATLADQNNGVIDGFGGIPFPIPQDVHEVIWNHLNHQIWWSFEATYLQAAVYDSGKVARKRYSNYARAVLYDRRMGREGFDNLAAYFIQLTHDPVRQRGEIILVHEFQDQVKDPRAAWAYFPGTRRVRRAPTVGYDNPSGTGGLRTDDDGQGFNGAIDRYNWTMIGKKEIYIPYNTYKFEDSSLKYDQILTPHHTPPEFMRYELHRVWIVEANLKPGSRHVYAKRRFYIDEDSWLAHLVDNFDGKGGLWRSLQICSLNAYDMPGITNRVEMEFDFHAKAYVVDKLYNEEPGALYTLDEPFPIKYFTPANLRKLGKR